MLDVNFFVACKAGTPISWHKSYKVAHMSEESHKEITLQLVSNLSTCYAAKLFVIKTVFSCFCSSSLEHCMNVTIKAVSSGYFGNKLEGEWWKDEYFSYLVSSVNIMGKSDFKLAMAGCFSNK